MLITDLERRTVAAKAVAKAVQGAAVGGRLPLVRDSADLLAARVNRAVLPIPYIERDVEDKARTSLMAGRPVLLVGSSMVGKTQMAVNLINALFADRDLVMPDSIDALAQLEAAG